MGKKKTKAPNRTLSPKVTEMLYDLFEIDAKIEPYRDQRREQLRADPAGAVEALLETIQERLSERGSGDLENTVGKGAIAFFDLLEEESDASGALTQSQ